MTLSTTDLGVRRGRHWAVRNVDLTIAPGRFTALLGPNGAGKSSLLGALSGDLAAREGRVDLEGQPLSAWTAVDLAHRRAVLPQHAELGFDFPVLDVVRMGRTPFSEPLATSEGIARRVLARLGMGGFADRTWFSLSGGERQRVQLARVLTQIEGRPDPILLLDEPTNHLDIRQRFEVLDQLRRAAAAGTTVVAVLHDLDLAARFADRVVLMARGRLVAAGPTEEVLTVGRIASVFGLTVTLVPDGTSGRPLPVASWPGLCRSIENEHQNQQSGTEVRA